MAGFKGKFDSVRQDWETPKELFDKVNQKHRFTLDVAASEKNKKTDKFISEKQDAMKIHWGKNVCWLNPPYGKGYRLSVWVKKAYEESLLGTTTVMLIPARTNTNWFHDFCLKYGEVEFVRGRPKFVGADHGLPQPLCFVTFRG
jgi:site-specific DNA-methyltransferase (adenine-specific)